MSALDGKSRISIMDAIRNWRRDKTTVIITHDVTQIPDNDFVYILHNGTVLMGGTRRELDARGELAPFLHLHTDQGEIMGQVIIDDYNYEIIHPPPYSTLSTSLNIPFETMTRLNRTNNKFPGSPIELPDYHQKVQVQEPRTPIKKRGGNSTTTSLFGRIHNSIWKVDSFKQGKNYRNGTLLRILGTVWPVLSPQEKLLVFVGATAALCHAVSTPLFSYALAKLLSTFSTPDKSEESITQWSIRVLMLAVGNGFCSYTMHYLLDSIGQTWVDRLRIRALSRILEQPREWFNKEQNSVSRIMEDLEKNAEEMRNLAGKFAGYAFVASVMITTGVIWSFLGCWQLTLVGLVILPCMYGITRGFAWVSDVWEERCNEAAENTGQVLIEAVTNVQTVKILRLDRYFCNKYSTAAREAMKFGLRRSMFAGVGFGLADSAILFALGTFIRNYPFWKVPTN